MNTPEKEQLSPKTGKLLDIIILLAVLAFLAVIGIGPHFMDRAPTNAKPSDILKRDDTQPGKKLMAFMVLSEPSYSIVRNKDDSLTARFTARAGLDLPACEQYYGKDTARFQCGVAYDTFIQKNAESVEFAINGGPEGKWLPLELRERSFQAVYEVPLEKLPGGKNYELELKSGKLPDNVVFKSKKANLKTSAMKARIESWQLLQDPEDQSKLIFQGVVNANYPLDPDSVKKFTRVSFQPAKDGKDLSVPEQKIEAGETEITLAPGGYGFSVAVPLKRLPSGQMNAILEISPSLARAGLPETLGQPYSLGTSVPSADSVVQVSGVATTLVTNDRQQTEQTLVINFTTKINTEEAARSVKAMLLPLYRTEEDRKAKRAFNWAEILPEQLEAGDMEEARQISLEAIPSANPDEYMAAFRYKTPPMRYLLIVVEAGITSPAGYTLHDPASYIIQAPRQETALEIMQKGAILSRGGEKKLAVFSRGLNKISWKAERVRPEFINLLISQSYSSDMTELPDDSRIAAEDISEIIKDSYHVKFIDENEPQYSSIDLTKVAGSGKNGIFNLRLYGEIPGQANTSAVTANRFILFTDLGMIVKLNDSDGSRAVFVSSFSRNAPVAGAKVEVLGRNGISVFSATTNKDGYAALPSIAGFKAEKKPLAILVKTGDDMTFMPLNDGSRSVYSVHENDDNAIKISEKALNAFVFSERGIYRPGETLHFGINAKNGAWNAEQIENLPLYATLYDSMQRELHESVVTLPATGLAELNIPLDESSPTGRYHLELRLGKNRNSNVIGSTSVQVEEFQPDKLKVNTDLTALPPQAVKGWVLPEDISAEVRVLNLYGTPAVGNRVKAELSISPAAMSFDGYKEFTFFSPGEYARHTESSLGENVTDEQGVARFAVDLEKYKGGSYWLGIEAEGFEPGGGRSVVSRKQIRVSPFRQIVGWASSADLGFIPKGSPVEVSFIALSPDLSRTRIDNLEMSISEVTYVASLVRKPNGSYAYDHIRRLVEVEKKIVNIADGDVTGAGEAGVINSAARRGGLKVSLPTSGTGEYELVLKDSGGEERCRLNFTVAGGAARRFGQERDVVMRIKTDKPSYNAGEVMRLFISAPYSGTGLITLESDHVLHHQWFNAQTSDSVHEIMVPDDFEGRAFVNVSLVRSLDSEAIHTSPYTNAIAPFLLNIDRRDMFLRLSAPEKIEPGKKAVFKISAQKPGNVIVFAVDEGILQLTRYKTPSAIDYFLRQNKLGVGTRQTLDLLMPEYGLLMKQSAFGGDFAAEMAGRLNPFRRKSEPAVVYWSGLVKAGPEETALEWDVPAYFNGTLRVMAIGGGVQAVGEASSSTLVQGPLVITPDLPVAVAPGDEFEVTVSIANNIEGSGSALPVKLEVGLDEGLSIVKAPESGLTVKEGRDARTVMRLKANDRLGESTVRLTARAVDKNGKQHEAARPVSLSVRPASPKISSFMLGYLKNNEQTVPFGRSLYPQYASVEASLSGLPLPLVDALSNFLLNYPHGCTEQILSAAFPYVLLHSNPELLPLPSGKTPQQAREDAVKAVNKAVLALKERQPQSGRFSLWPRDNYTYFFLTAYAFDFLLSAREAGFNVPEDLYDSARRETAAIIAAMPGNMEMARISAYGAWVQARSGKLVMNLPQFERYCDEHLKGWRSDITAALVASCYSMMKQNKEAEALIKNVNLNKAAEGWGYGGWFFDRLWADGVYLNVITRNFPERLGEQATRATLENAVNGAADGRYTTTGSVQAVRGIASYAMANSAANSDVTLSVQDKNHKAFDLGGITPAGELVKRLRLEGGLASQSAEFKFTGGKGLYWQISADGFDLTPPQKSSKGINLKVAYIPVDKKPIDQLAQGDEVYVLITANSLKPVDNVAISSLIPGGFEMVISRAGEIVGGGTSDEENGSEENGESEEEEYENEEYSEEEPMEQGVTAAHPSRAHMNDVRAMLDAAGLNQYNPMSLVHVERREDRMVLFTSLDTGDTVFIYRIKAVNKGSFTQPAVFAEALYDRDLRANTAPERLEVK